MWRLSKTSLPVFSYIVFLFSAEEEEFCINDQSFFQSIPDAQNIDPVDQNFMEFLNSVQTCEYFDHEENQKFCDENQESVSTSEYTDAQISCCGCGGGYKSNCQQKKFYRSRHRDR